MRVTIELLPDATAPVGIPPTAPPRLSDSDVPVIKWLLRGRWLQWGLTVVTLAVFLVVILTGLFGTPAGNHNFGIIYVWLVWWALLKLVLVPFLGRFWCSVCPIPAPGDWLQRRGMITPRPGGKLYTYATGLFRKTASQARQRAPWPKFLRNIWAQNFGFLAIALFSALILTSPLVTAHHPARCSSWSRSSSACSSSASRSAATCARSAASSASTARSRRSRCASRTRRSARATRRRPATPAATRATAARTSTCPQKLETNTLCSMCGECLRTCDRDNIAFYVRMPGTDLLNTRGRRLDEAFNGLMMLAAAFVYSVVLIGPDGWLKATAPRGRHARPGSLYAAVLLLFCGVLVPGLFWLCVRLGRVLNGERDRRGSPATARPASRRRSPTASSPTTRRRWCRWAWRSGSPSRCPSR